jgi:hypothetical protein
MAKDALGRIASRFQEILVGLSILIGLIILGWQVYVWLRTGYWIQMPLSKVFGDIGVDLTRVYHPSPRDWQSVSKLARSLLAWPMTLSVPIIIGILSSIIKILIRWDPFHTSD